MKTKTIKQIMAECDAMKVRAENIGVDTEDSRILYDNCRLSMLSRIRQERDRAAMRIGKK